MELLRQRPDCRLFLEYRGSNVAVASPADSQDMRKLMQEHSKLYLAAAVLSPKQDFVNLGVAFAIVFLELLLIDYYDSLLLGYCLYQLICFFLSHDA